MMMIILIREVNDAIFFSIHYLYIIYTMIFF